MKISTYAVPVMGAVLAAFLIHISPAKANTACACDCPPKIIHHAAVRHAPARTTRFVPGADAEYAQAAYNYHSSSRADRVVVAGPWVQAPNDARFYPQRAAYATEPDGIRINPRDFNGGVGETESASGGGSGYVTGGNGIYNSYDPTADNQARARFGFYNRVGSAPGGNNTAGH